MLNFYCKVLLYLNEILAPAQDMLCYTAAGTLCCYSESTEQRSLTVEYLKLDTSRQLPRDIFSAYKFRQNENPKKPHQKNKTHQIEFPKIYTELYFLYNLLPS